MKFRNVRYQKCRDPLLYIFVFSIIFQSGTVQASTNSADLVFLITRILMLFLPLLLYLFNVNREKKVAIKFVVLVILFELFAVINYCLYSQSATTLQYKILLFVLFYLMLSSSSKMISRMEEIIYNTILFIAIVTILFYVVVEILKLPLPYTIYHKADGYSFTYRNYFYIYYSYSNATFPRLSGLFTEPGMFQIYMNFALFLFYKKKNQNKIQLLILLLNILFAQSTSGYIVATILLATILTSWKKMSISNRTLLGIILGVVTIVVVLIVFIQKRESTNIAGDSYFDRMAQAKLGVELFLQKPIMGWGFYNTTQYGNLDVTNSGNSNGLLTWLYTTGLVGLFLALFPFVYNLKRSISSSEKWEKIVWMFFILIENMVEPIYSLSIMVFVLTYEYFQMINIKKIRKSSIIRFSDSSLRVDVKKSE